MYIPGKAHDFRLVLQQFQRFFLFFVHFRFAEYVMEVFDLFLTSGEAKIVKNFCKTNNFYRFSIKTQ